ncbi:type II toxin-antitoxin system VapC family toxin [Saccharomonospora piscinae]|uniref:PIN domain-containing protein n=1 Tax=Saccharomonospora piscinae TaxID=687388 RepID=UPI001105FF07|nr:PIN domain-containing protein [Saccharomonospora piscinae]TLW93863.1 type II toxin-antitoxin system VapC family toxin [Saccharomonospora piscinae]
MRVYLDTSALLKRIFTERETDAFVEALDRWQAERSLLVSSSLAWVEVARSVRVRLEAPFGDVEAQVDRALVGVAESPISPEVISLARRIGPTKLRSLDAIHLAAALLLDADLVVTYDDRLAEACRDVGLRATSPTA